MSVRQTIHKLKRAAIQNAEYLRQLAIVPTVDAMPGASASLITIARNMEITMDRIEKIITAELSAKQKLSDENTALKQNITHSPAEESAIRSLAVGNGLDPTSGDPPTSVTGAAPNGTTPPAGQPA